MSESILSAKDVELSKSSSQPPPPSSEVMLAREADDITPTAVSPIGQSVPIGVICKENMEVPPSEKCNELLQQPSYFIDRTNGAVQERKPQTR